MRTMSEWKLFTDEEAYVSTFEFHEHRERAAHLEQANHVGRLHAAFRLVLAAAEAINKPLVRVIDLGCGDGGLLQLLKADPGVAAQGYDFQPSNAAGWVERGVHAEALNFVEHWDEVPLAHIYVMTECLEHLTKPHEMVGRIAERNAHLVCSSPFTEHAGSHDECHAWAWDMEGYAQMIKDEGFVIHVQEPAGGMFQVVWAS